VKRLRSIVAVVGLLLLAGGTLFSQPPEDRDPRGGRPAGRREGPPSGGRPGPWEPGKIMPPHVRDGLKLSTDQQRQIAELEKEVKERILKILTDDQKKQLKDLRSPGPPPGDRSGPPRRGRPAPPDRDEDRPPPRDDSEQ
jgi:hypothetical protein